jgi:hypothetical protein
VCTLAFARDQSGFRSKEPISKARDPVNQFIETGAGRAGNKVNDFIISESRFNSLSRLL